MHLFSLLLFLSGCGPIYENQTWKDSDFEVRTSYLKGTTNKHILIIPPTGGINIIDKSYGLAFAKKGFHVHILTGWTGDDEFNFELSIHDRFYKRANRAVQIVLENIPETDEVGILGTSVGALHSAIALGSFPRIKSGFFITGGADIPSIIANSDQGVMVQAKEKRFEEHKFTDISEYISALRAAIELEPLSFEKELKKKSVGLIVSTEDKTVPYLNQKLLQDATQPVYVKSFSDSHVTTIVKTWLFYRSEVVSFFQSHL